ncbi:MAG TPA: hypothetical protein VHY48_08820 [Acidobacteriaceae bacterium]|jgi:hypothetical protein|nr:hypothetical protein [Acidobacteriaceae bacterium]
MQNEKTTRIIIRALGATGLVAALIFGAAGCHSNSASSGPDPADANLAPANGTQVMAQNASYTPQQQGETYPQGQQAPAPVVQGTAEGPSYDQNAAEEAGEEAIEQTNEAPPPLPEYDQPPCPGPDYIWTPGYWAWGPGGYYWVPGAWVEAPYYGALWTPPYWGWYNGYYRFYPGYWGPHVGYYGGIDYGFGYIGIGYFGGYWSGNNFYYNRAVTRVGGGDRYVYNRPVIYNNVHYGARPSNRVSYNGGRGGVNVRPRPSEIAAARERHDPALPTQRQLRTTASQNHAQFFNQNHGRPSASAETHGFRNAHGIAPTPHAVAAERTMAPPPNAARGHEAPGARPGMNPAGRNAANPAERNAPPARNATPAHNAQPNRAAPAGRPTPAARPGQPRVENHAAPAPRVENRPSPQPRTENRPTTQPRAVTPQPRVENRPAPQPRVENRPAPQPRVANRPTPQPRVENRPAPQPRVANRPAPRAAAPRAAAPRPAPHPQASHPEGGDHNHR